MKTEVIRWKNSNDNSEWVLTSEGNGVYELTKDGVAVMDQFNGYLDDQMVLEGFWSLLKHLVQKKEKEK
jgi:hypothetical protein